MELLIKYNLRQKVLNKFGFKRMWMEKHGKYIEVWADFNPKILLMRGNAEQIDDLSEDQLKRLRKMDDNTELIGKKIDGGVVIGDEHARRFNAGKVDESLDELIGMDSREIREITSVSSSKSTYQLGKGIEKVDGPIPDGFQRHHIIPESALNNKELKDFFDDIGFDIQDGTRNGIALPSNKEALENAVRNNGFANPNATMHLGSHMDEYGTTIIDNCLELRVDFNSLSSQIGKDQARRIILLKVENLAKTTKDGLLNGIIKLN